MKFINCIFFLLALSCFEANSQDDMFHIKGESRKDGTIFLYKKKDGIIQFIDTGFVKEGYFSFYGKEDMDNFASIVKYEDSGERKEVELVLEKGIIHVDLDSARATGTNLNNLYTQYQDSDKYYTKMIKETITDENRISPSSLLVPKGSDLHKVYDSYGRFTLNFKKKNINNIVGKEMFLREIQSNFGEGIYVGDEHRFYDIYDLCDEDFKSNDIIVKYKERLDAGILRNSKMKNLIDSKYTDFTVFDQDGNKRKISDYVGKSDLLFLDFWASWCSPCLNEIPNLKNIFNKYKDKGFNVLSISLDTQKSAWKNAIEMHDLFWDNVSDLKGTGSELTNAYLVGGIPCGILLDRDGKILSYMLSINSLEFEIHRYLDNK